jgi:hypothetical protein
MSQCTWLLENTILKCILIKLIICLITISMVQSLSCEVDTVLAYYELSFMAPKGSLLCSQKRETGPYPEPDKSSLQPLYIRYILILT